MDDHGASREIVLKELETAQSRDMAYTSGCILGSMCTSPNEFAKDVFSRFLEINLGDAGLFPGTKELERRAVISIADLLGFKSREGLLVTGGTEGNILALWAARNKSGRKGVIAPETSHFSLDKACNLLGLKMEKAEVDDENRVDLGDVESKVDDETCAIVGVAGSTEYGSIDDIKGLSDIARAKGTHLHVDAAFGGFVIPFLEELGYLKGQKISLSGVDTLTVDPHKMGLAPIPCGCLLLKEPELLKYIETESPYLTEKRQHTIAGTRTGAAAAATFAVIKHLGRDGYREIVKGCMENTIRLYRGLLEMDIVASPPTMNIQVFEGSEGVYEGLENMGWRLSRTRKSEIRIVVMPHVTEQVVFKFLSDLKRLQR